MRIIAGINRSRKIKEVAANSTRHTADMVREAVFNILGNINGKKVLDLFAGSGAYGLEALSRGAVSCYFNDNNKLAYETILENVTVMGYLGVSHIYSLDYNKAIGMYKNGEVFDLIFLDPPYGFSSTDRLLEIILPILADDGIIIIEQSKSDPQIDIEQLEIYTNRKYGSKRVIFYKKCDIS